ncbi:hypothetical protein J437_LFUL005921 [Ladona fulva]|uniref:Uncharacterized protein n=1 Tax=Ladona fulva TaxID=123851 RepID=A0A8K0P322_LADFU|nr:hypothetical protein J437_LFUL005921 [Ladona fulva]
MHCNVAPKVAFLACSIIVFLMEAPSAKAAVEEVDNAPSSTEELKMRAKRYLNVYKKGCGKKRSEGASRLGALEKMAQLTDGDLGDQSGMSESESLATLVELNSEPAVAELSRQILSEAKLWEAIQEARQEMSRRRQQV